MKTLIQALLLTCALLPCFATQAADAPIFDVLRDMSVADFRAAGLDRLSDEQIKALNAWFTEYQRKHAPCAAVSAVAAAPASLAMTASPTIQGTTAIASLAPGDEYSAHLDGTFRGWGDGTTFKLDNGEVWQQIDDTELNVGAIKNPKVTIKRGMFTAYYLSVEGVDDSVLVRRIKP
jgi:hypothetical protein